MQILAKNNNILNYFIYYNKKKYLLGNKRLENKKDQKNLLGKNSNNRNIINLLFGHIFQNNFFQVSCNYL